MSNAQFRPAANDNGGKGPMGADTMRREVGALLTHLSAAGAPHVSAAANGTAGSADGSEESKEQVTELRSHIEMLQAMVLDYQNKYIQSKKEAARVRRELQAQQAQQSQQSPAAASAQLPSPSAGDVTVKPGQTPDLAMALESFRKENERERERECSRVSADLSAVGPSEAKNASVSSPIVSPPLHGQTSTAVGEPDFNEDDELARAWQSDDDDLSSDSDNGTSTMGQYAPPGASAANGRPPRRMRAQTEADSEEHQGYGTPSHRKGEHSTSDLHHGSREHRGLGPVAASAEARPLDTTPDGKAHEKAPVDVEAISSVLATIVGSGSRKSLAEKSALQRTGTKAGSVSKLVQQKETAIMAAQRAQDAMAGLEEQNRLVQFKGPAAAGPGPVDAGSVKLMAQLAQSEKEAYQTLKRIKKLQKKAKEEETALSHAMERVAAHTQQVDPNKSSAVSRRLSAMLKNVTEEDESRERRLLIEEERRRQQAERRARSQSVALPASQGKPKEKKKKKWSFW